MKCSRGIICLGIFLAGAGTAWAQAERTSPETLAFGEPPALPLVLRGSAIPPPPARAAAIDGAPRWEIVAGERLWLVDRETGDVRSCFDKRTSTVGVREIRCTSDTVGRFRRTFGRTFSP